MKKIMALTLSAAIGSGVSLAILYGLGSGQMLGYEAGEKEIEITLAGNLRENHEQPAEWEMKNGAPRASPWYLHPCVWCCDIRRSEYRIPPRLKPGSLAKPDE
jgi:hypothetical protein